MKYSSIIIGIIVLLLIGAGVYFVSNQGSSLSPAVNQDSQTPIANPIDSQTVKSFTVGGKPFAFSPTEIRVKKGDTVKITFTNEQGFHNFMIAEYSVKTKDLQAGQSDTVQFIADKAGTFEYFCGVPTHKEKGMVGQLIIED